MPNDGICIEATFVSSGSSHNLIYCNFVGTDHLGNTAHANGRHVGTLIPLWGGIRIVCPYDSAGVADFNQVVGNLCSGNNIEGIALQNNPPLPDDVGWNNVLNNYVGTDISGVHPLGNGRCGIYLGEGTHHNLVDGNLCCANGYDGISLNGFEDNLWYTHSNTISNNTVGENVLGQSLGNLNHGISLGAYGPDTTLYEGFTQDNRIANNIIGFNSRCGVMVWEQLYPPDVTNADFNIITQNSIYYNGYTGTGYLGIDLQGDGLTTNDVGDGDPGPNNFVNFPLITGVVDNGLTVTISGVVDIDTDPAQATIEVFQAIPDATGTNHGQGAYYLGSTTPDAAGSWSVTVTGVSGQDWITATTTDRFNNTSEFSLNVQVPGFAHWDFGDAMDPTYPTLYSSNGARHMTGSPYFMGTTPDSEPDGQPSPQCDGDDLNGPDEDGVMFTHMFIPGQQTSLTVFASQSGMLDMWIDFAVDGSWWQPGDQIFSAYPLTAGSNPVYFTIPATVPVGVSTSSRFRFSSGGGLAVTGACNHGEVEDWEITFEEEAWGIDFGDAPPPYPTLFVSNGASHVVSTGLYLGNNVDTEFDGQPSATASGDDLNGFDDEDGIGFLSPVIPGAPFTIQVTASLPGILDAWLDFDGNGSWAEGADNILQGVAVPAGTNLYTVTAPVTAQLGTTYARFRLSDQGVASYTGQHWCGEVEDHQVMIIEGEFDYGDAPDPTYPTLLASNGAVHYLNTTIVLGTLIDAEPDGQPDATATGDDLSNLPDEDGVTLTALVPGRQTTATITASSFGRLNSWLDYNADGDWSDPNEQIFTDAILLPGPNNLSFNVPLGVTLGNTFSRWRFNTIGGLSYTGYATNGEVEDHQVTIRCGIICPPGSILEDEPCGTLLNQGCDSDDPVFTTIACLDTMCAETWADTSWRDTDWYELNVPVPMRVRWTLASDIPLQFGYVEPITPGYVDCDSLTGVIDPWANVNACDTSTIEVDLTAAGTYWFWVGPQTFSGYPCDEGPWLYYHYMDCLGLYLEVTITYDGTDIRLDWDAVAGADRYTIYSATDPYATFPDDWTVEGTTTGTTWSETYPGGIKFYRVVAVMDVVATASEPHEDLKLIMSDKQLK